MGVLVDDEVKKRRLPRLERRFELRRKISRVFNSHAGATACAGDRRMVDRTKFARFRVGVEHDSFPVFLIAKDLVVQHDRDYGQLVAHNGLELGSAMSEAPSPVTQSTGRSGSANCAPLANGKPQPRPAIPRGVKKR